MSFIQKFIRDEDGVTAIEYALIAALIAVAITLAVTQLGTKISTTFDSIKTSL
jgi:pilus assembly protein Flp/PilA